MGSPTPVRVVFFGMRCDGSPPALRALLVAGHDVVAVIRPGLLSGRGFDRLPDSGPSLGSRTLRISPTITATTARVRETLDQTSHAARVPMFVVGDLNHPSVIT